MKRQISVKEFIPNPTRLVEQSEVDRFFLLLPPYRIIYVTVISKTLEHIETFNTNCKVLS